MRHESRLRRRVLLIAVALIAGFIAWRLATLPDPDPFGDDVPARPAALVGELLPLLAEPMDKTGSRATPEATVPSEVDVSDRALTGWFADHALALEALCVDVDGRPLAGVEVTVSQGGFESTAVSDADGRVRIERNLAWLDMSLTLESIVLGRKRRPVRLFDHGQMQVNVVARLARHAPAEAWREIILGETVQAGTLVLMPAGTIEGRVLDPEGDPAVGAIVRIRGSAARREGPLGAEPFRSLHAADVLADSSGHFVIEGVVDGTSTVEATDASGRTGLSAIQDVHAGATASVEIRLEDAIEKRSVVVRVLASDGAPVPGAIVVARDSQGGRPVQVSTRASADADGIVRWTASATAIASIDAWDPSGRHGTARVEDVTLGTQEIVLRLGAARTIELEVVRADGLALSTFFASIRMPNPERADAVQAPNAEILGVLFDDGDLFANASADPASPGRARIPIPDREFVVRVSTPGMRRAARGPFEPDSAPASLRVELEPLPTLRGRVTRDGQGVAGAEVTRCTPLEGGRTWIRNSFPTRFANEFGSLRTDRDGRFVLPIESATGTYVRAEARGSAPTEVGPFSPTDFDSAQIEIHLTRGGDLEGEVVVDAGRDPAGIVVGITRGDGFDLTRRTDRAGRFRFEYLTPGDWFVHEHDREISLETSSLSFGTYGPEMAWPRNASVAEGRTTRFVLDLREPPRLVLAGRAPTDGRTPASWGVSLRAVEYSMRTLERERAAAVVPADGRFELVVHEPGDYRLELSEAVTKSRGRKILDTISMPTNEVWSCDSPTGTVAGNAPRTGPRLHVRARTPSGAIVLCPIFPEESGAFRVENVPAGVVAIVEEPPASFGREFETWPDRLEIRVGRDAVTNVDLR